MRVRHVQDRSGDLADPRTIGHGWVEKRRGEDQRLEICGPVPLWATRADLSWNVGRIREGRSSCTGATPATIRSTCRTVDTRGNFPGVDNAGRLWNWNRHVISTMSFQPNCDWRAPMRTNSWPSSSGACRSPAAYRTRRAAGTKVRSLGRDLDGPCVSSPLTMSAVARRVRAFSAPCS